MGQTVRLTEPVTPSVPAPRAPAVRRPRAALLAAVAFGFLAVVLAAFLLTGAMLTIGLFVLPVLAIVAVYYMVRFAKPGGPRPVGPEHGPMEQ